MHAGVRVRVRSCACVHGVRAFARVQAPGFGDGLQYTKATLAGAYNFEVAEVEVFAIQFPGQ